MQQIAEWLQKLGMSEYAERFAENRIDFSVLPELTDQDLKELGVVLGDRRKILRAIAAFTRAAAEQPAAEPVGVAVRTKGDPSRWGGPKGDPSSWGGAACFGASCRR